MFIWRVNDGYTAVNFIYTTIKITFTLPEDLTLFLIIYNLLIKMIPTLVSRELSASTHTLSWNANDTSGLRVSNSVYLNVRKASNIIMNNKMLLTKYRDIYK